jgi:hypothetical protein
MRARNSSLGGMLAVLLTGTASLALAGPLAKAQLPPLEADETDAETALHLNFVPEWQPASPYLGPFFKLDDPSTVAPAVSGTAIPATQSQSAIARGIRSGYSVGAEPESFPAQVSRAYTLSQTLQAGVRAGFDAPVGDVMNLTTASAETRLALGHVGPGISWGWHTGVDMTTPTQGNSALASGPQLKLGDDQLALTLSPRVAHTFGTGHSSDVTFAYAAGLKGALAEGVALGIEAFGATSDIGAAPGAALQNYRTTPGLYLGLGLTPGQKAEPNGSKLSLELGALADIKEAGPDWTGKLKAAVTW